jgi:hypothetical protein
MACDRLPACAALQRRPGARGARLALVKLSPLVLLAGCVMTQANLVGPVSYPPLAASHLQVYPAREHLPAACERLGTIRTRGDADLTTQRQTLRAACRRAARLGANALVVDPLRDPDLSTQIASFFLGTPSPRIGRMTAFRCAAEFDSAAP